MQIDFPINDGIQTLPRFLVSLAIGLLIGLERERNPYAKAGLRTFTLVALFGTLLASLSTKSDSPWLLGAGLLSVAAMIIAVYLNSQPEPNEPGTTTVAAVLVCYSLGVLSWLGDPILAVMIAVVVTVLLYFKPELHGLTHRLTRTDLVSILQFSVLTFVILPILPDESYGPYGVFNPHQAWLMVVLVSGLSLAGYVALHWAGAKYGAPLLGFLGGLASSTATTLVYARHSKASEEMARLSGVVILISSLVVMIRLVIVSTVVSPGIVPKLIAVLGIGFMLGLMATVYAWRRLKTASNLPIPWSANPTEIHMALGFGLMYVAVLFGSAWLSDIAGRMGLYVVSLVSGLTDVDAITLSSLRLFSLKQAEANDVVTSIAIANLSNMGFKMGLVVFIGGTRLAKYILLGFSAMAGGMLVGLLLI